MKPVFRWMVLSVAIFGAACQPQALETPAVVVEAPQEEPYVEPTATPDCQPIPDVTLEVRKTGPRSVSLHASGLRPGEKPQVIFGASTERFGAYGDTGIPVDGADDQGEYSLDVRALALGSGDPDAPASATWDFRLIHARGVACATITLP